MTLRGSSFEMESKATAGDKGNTGSRDVHSGNLAH